MDAPHCNVMLYVIILSVLLPEYFNNDNQYILSNITDI